MFCNDELVIHPSKAIWRTPPRSFLVNDGERAVLDRALDPPGVTLGADGDRATICTDALALEDGERVAVRCCFAGGSTFSLPLG